jgi:hypothetical protein
VLPKNGIISVRDCKKAEQEIIDSLITVRDTKKCRHKMESKCKVEANKEDKADNDEVNSDKKMKIICLKSA